MPYTVNGLATLAGVTPRTLRHYDRIGLLSPASRGRNGYRAYGEAELARLQQILFFRELDFPLPEIKAMLDAPTFDAVESLAYQKELLKLKRKRLDGIIRTIEKTIMTMHDDTRKVTDADLYEGLSTEEIEGYKKEAKERWGKTDAYKQSQERVAAFTKKDWDELKAEGKRNADALAALLAAGAAPESPEVQAEIARHHAGIERFYDCGKATYLGLADMYLADDRFRANYDAVRPGLAEFIAAGMREFAKTLK